ncbi:adenylate/guanylate cyclase domain-containing protein [bacterium]|nr:MAG: adenylate/guanylate cyclase domain-containing protein [bacterium]
MVASPPTTQTVTFLFTDIEGSTRLWEEHPDSMGPAVARHDTILRQTVEQFGGVVFKSLGDSIYAAFESPVSAVAAALEAQRALAAEEWPTVDPLRVRMAVHSGECEKRGDDYFGRPLNRTARLLAIGHGGQVLVSDCIRETTVDGLPEGAQLVPLGDHRLRDLTMPERVYGLVHPSLPSIFPPLRSAGRNDVPNNLPGATTTFVGREKEIVLVESALAKTRFLTLTGSGGCGKTRLALQVAAEVSEEYADGVWFVELARVSSSDLVPQAVADALGVGEAAGEDLASALAWFVRERRLLLILDNCEHLLDACGQLTDRLLRAAAGLKILATSREALGIAGEMVLRVPSLSLPTEEPGLTAEELLRYEAPRLFVERAVFHRPDFAVSDANATALAALCRRLDGIPLAIELAAARVRALSIEQIDARLDDRFRLLTGGSRAALPRQQTLRALVDWSHSLLTDVERTALRRLGVFNGGWSLEAAEAVLPGGTLSDWEVLDLLTSLVDKSLVQVDEQAGETRYRLLETVRQYALEKLLGEEDSAPTRQAHLAFFLRLAEEAALHLVGPEQGKWFPILIREHDNLRAALDWSGGEERLRLCGALYWFWHVRKFNGEGLRRIAEALDDPTSEEPSPALAKVLLGAGTLAYWLEDGRQEGFFLRGLEVCRAIGDRNIEGRILGNLGAMSVELRAFDQARTYLQQALEIHRALNLPARMAHQYCTLGFLEREQGNVDEARRNLTMALERSRDAGHRYLEAYTLMATGTVAVSFGQDDAPELLQAALRLAETNDIGPVAAASYAWLAEYNRLAGRLEEANRLVDQALKVAPDRDRILYEVYLILVRLRISEGDLAGAGQALAMLLGRAQRQAVAVDGLEAAAVLFAKQGLPKPAAVSLGAAKAFREEYAMPLHEVYVEQLSQVEDDLRRALDEPERFFQRGASMTPSEAVQYARVCQI